MDIDALLFGMTLAVHIPFAYNTFVQFQQDWRPQFRKWNMPAYMPFVLVPLQIVFNAMLWEPSTQLLGLIGLYVIVLAAVMTLTRYYAPRDAYLWPLLTLALLVGWTVVWQQT